MNDVQIDGVKYIPVSEATNIQVKMMREVLKSQKYLSSSAIEDIISAFRKVNSPEKPVDKEVKTKPTVDKKTKKRVKAFKYQSQQSVLFNISTVQSNGAVLFKRRVNPTNWNIQQAIIIRKHMNNDSSKGLTNESVQELMDKTGLSKHIVMKIMYNIEFGDLVKWIKYWRINYNQNLIKSSKPIQNNPQKRKEGVIYQ